MAFEALPSPAAMIAGTRFIDRATRAPPVQGDSGRQGTWTTRTSARQGTGSATPRSACDTRVSAGRFAIRALVDALVWSSAWVALAAVALCAGASAAMGLAPAAPVLWLAAAGTLVVYNVDRLRDVERDRFTSPERSAFVTRHRRALLALAGLAGVACAVAAVAVGPRVVALAAAVAALGFFHRRLKRLVWLKPAYLTLAWVAVTVGFPAAFAGATSHLLGAALVVGCTVQANVVLSNLRDGEGLAARMGRPRALRTAASFLGVAGLVPLVLEGTPLALLAIPVGMVPAVAGFRPGERFGGAVVDGGLVAGGLACWLLAAGPAAG